MQINIVQHEGQAQVSFSGPLTIEHASNLREQLEAALKSASQISIDLKQTDEVDLACLQALCSAHRTAEAMGKRFSIGESPSESFLRTVENAGYERYKGCGRDKTGTCLWSEKYREKHP